MNSFQTASASFSMTEQQQQQCRRRTVSFARTLQARRTIHINDYTPEEIAATWYSKDEYKTIVQKLSKIIQKMQSTQHQKYQYCTRGLETLVGQRAEQKRQYRQETYDIVLTCGYCHGNDETIARMYQEISAVCHDSAHQRGRRDAQCARRYMFPDEVVRAQQQQRPAHNNQRNASTKFDAASRQSMTPTPNKSGARAA